MTINDFFDNVFIINLDSRPDRMENIVQQLKYMNITKYERAPAVKIETVEPQYLEYYKKIYEYNVKNTKHSIDKLDKITKEQLGCKLSHVNAIQLAKKRGYTNILILEDDAIFTTDVNKILKKVFEQIKHISWDILYLGGRYKKKHVKQYVSNNLATIEGACETHAYSVTNHIYDTILNGALKYDNSIDAFYADIIQKKHIALGVVPKIAFQKNDYSDIDQAIRERKINTGDFSLFKIFSRRKFIT